MRIDFGKVLTDFEGQPIKESPRPDSKEVTLKTVCINALLGNGPDEKIDGTEKLRRYQLANKIHCGTQEISIEEAKTIKELVGKAYNTIVVGQVFEILEGK